MLSIYFHQPDIIKFYFIFTLDIGRKGNGLAEIKADGKRYEETGEGRNACVREEKEKGKKGERKKNEGGRIMR